MDLVSHEGGNPRGKVDPIVKTENKLF